MSITNPNSAVTKQDLKAFYDGILPYLGGSVSTGFTPVGTVISVMGNTAPANYLECNGQIVNISDYQELADYFRTQFGESNYFGGDGTTTFGIPDLRGEFLRGTGTNSHVDNGDGANVGVHQDGTQVRSTWLYPDNVKIQSRYLQSEASVYPINVINSDKNITKPVGTQVIDTLQTNTKSEWTIDNPQDFSNVVRPTNTSVLFCIAVKNIYMGDGNSSMNYSTDEQLVGTWIDGKPLYQKTLDIITDATSTETRESISSLDTDFVNIINSTLVRNNGAMISQNAVGLSSIKFVTYVEASKNILILVGDDENNKGAHTYITIQYTKTTD